jgi:hypothetical protein
VSGLLLLVAAAWADFEYLKQDEVGVVLASGFTMRMTPRLG